MQTIVPSAMFRFGSFFIVLCAVDGEKAARSAVESGVVNADDLGDFWEFNDVDDDFLWFN
jgi:hypothetical protein